MYDDRVMQQEKITVTQQLLPRSNDKIIDERWPTPVEPLLDNVMVCGTIMPTPKDTTLPPDAQR